MTSPQDRLSESDADEAITLEKEIGPPGDNMLSRYQQDVMEQIRKRLEKVGAPAKVTVTIEVEEVES